MSLTDYEGHNSQDRRYYGQQQADQQPSAYQQPQYPPHRQPPYPPQENNHNQTQNHTRDRGLGNASLGSTPRFPPVPGTVNTGGVGAVGVRGDREQDRGRDRDVQMSQAHGGSREQGLLEESKPLPFPGSIDPYDAPSEWRKDGSDWLVLFNPDAAAGGGNVGNGRVGVRRERESGKNLDVSLMHSLQHERWVPFLSYLYIPVRVSARLFLLHSLRHALADGAMSFPRCGHGTDQSAFFSFRFF